jgi:hypothetical protein
MNDTAIRPASLGIYVRQNLALDSGETITLDQNDTSNSN